MNTRGIIWLLAGWMALPLQGNTGHESMPDPAARIGELRREVAHHDELYFRHAQPEISDAAYDALRRELEDLERAWPEAAQQSQPLQSIIGDDRTGQFPDCAHRVPMLSLKKSFSNEEVLAFHTGLVDELGEAELEYWIEPKVDGMAVSLAYEAGKLTRILSRGDGRAGEDLTELLRQVPGLPQILRAIPGSLDQSPPAFLELRGELFVPWAAFQRINELRELEGQTPYTSPRNMAVGLARSRELSGDLLASLRMVVFGWGAWEPPTGQPSSYTQFRDLLRGWSIPILEEASLVKGPEDLVEGIGALGCGRATWPFAGDGVVVKLNSTRDRDRLGCDEQAPRWAIAHKFPADEVETILLGITWQVGRTGVLTPVAELEPVSLMGRRVARANLHNFGFIRNGDYRAEDTVMVKLAGDVIPALAGSVVESGRTRGEPFAMPERCPACGSQLVLTEGSPVVKCLNPDCRGCLAARIAHFCQCHGIKGMGDSMIHQLIQGGHLSSLADLFQLDQDTLAGSTGCSLEEAEVLVEMIAHSRSSSLEVQIEAAGLPGVGRSGAKQLAMQFADFADFVRGYATQVEPPWRQRLKELLSWYL